MNNKLLFILALLLQGMQIISAENVQWNQADLSPDLQDTDTVLNYAQQSIDWLRENPQDKEIVGLALKGAGELLMQSQSSEEDVTMPMQEDEMIEDDYRISTSNQNNGNDSSEIESQEMQEEE